LNFIYLVAKNVSVIFLMYSGMDYQALDTRLPFIPIPYVSSEHFPFNSLSTPT